MSRDLQPPPPPLVSAEKLAAEALEADEAEWLSFRIKETGWRSRQMGELSTWLEQNKPSQVLRSDGIGWISVYCGSADDEDLSVADCMAAVLEEGANARTEWETYEGERNMETVNRLAEKYDIKSGKWLLHVSSEWIDKMWSKLAMALLRGDLSPAIDSMKVSPRDPPTEQGSSHVLLVYNEDYQDKTQVMKAESLLRSAGLMDDLHYKPDIFTHLGIYRNNIWGIRPSIYTSKMSRGERKSKITGTGTDLTMTSSEESEELEAEMTNLTVELLSLSQDLITAKLRLEAAAKSGWILLAKARYVSQGGGGAGLSISQVPASEGDRQMVAGVRIHTKECLQDNKVRYFHHNLLEPGHEDQDGETGGLRQRGGQTDEKVGGEERRGSPSSGQSDPLKWFGLLTPPALRQSQASFKTAAELAVETANIQSEMAGVVNRIKFIQRRLKSGPAKQNIEDLDASFSSSLKI